MEKKSTEIRELHQKENVLGKISSMFIDRYRTVYLILLAIFIVGWLSYSGLPRENMPEVESNIVVISTVYSGAAPQDIEEMITEPLEDAVSGLDDLVSYSSVSASGYSSITLEYEYGIDMDEAVDEAKKEVEKVNLPDDAQDANVWHLKTTEIPILQLSVTGSSNLSTVSQAADDLKNAVESVSGIDSVSLRGETETIVQIVVNPAELEAYGVTVSSISQAIQSVNVGMPAGSADLDGQTFNVRIDEAFKSVEDVKNVLIKTGAGSLRLSDIADVNLIDDEGDTISRTYRKEEGPKTSPVVYMSVYRDNGADTIGPVNEILNIIEEGRGSLYPDDIQVIITSNFAEDVEDSLGTVMDSAISGLLVVVLVLFLFIDLREALIVSLIIPLSMLVSCTVMAQVGITLNSVSLMGFVIALGLLVDNAIVVIENIDRIRDYGIDRKTAAKVAINQVAPAVLAATLTTLSAFVPLAMTGGMLGLMLRSLPMTILFSISASFLISLIVTPTIAARALEKYKGKEKETRGAVQFYKKIVAVVSVGALALFAFKIDGTFSIFSYIGAVVFSAAMYIKQFKMKSAHGEGQHILKYSQWLSQILESRFKKVLILVVAVVMLVASLALLPLGFIQMELMPNEEPDSMTINVELPKGYLISDTSEIVKTIENRLYQFEDIESFTSTIGGDDANEASVIVELVDEDMRKISGYDMIGHLRRAVADIPGADIGVDAALNAGHGPGGGDPITIRISGGSSEDMEALAETYYKVLAQIEGVEDASISSMGGLSELIVDFNPALAQAKGLSITSMAMDVRTAVSGSEAGDFRFDGEEVEIEIQTTPEKMDSINDLEKLMFKSSSGQLIPFGEVAKIRIDSGVSQIRHNDGQVYLTLGASNAPDANLNQIVRTFQTQVKDIPLPSGVEVSYGGEFDMMGDTFSDMGRNMIFALLLVYILLSVQFNSMTQPLVIIISVPLALIGTFIGLAVTGNNLGFYSLFGIVSLVGIAVNDAIVLVDYTNYLRKEGFKRNDALVEAVKTRFNPVFATSITTIGGVLPISVADPALGQLGYALIFGLMASTVLTLLIIPIAYSVSDGVTTSIRDRFGIFAEETEEIISEA